MKIAALFFCLLLTPLSGFANSKLDGALSLAKEKQIAGSAAWHRLLHYRTAVFSRQYESQADGESFFVSPQGRSDPEAELIATLKGFFDGNPRSEQLPSVRCQFPARWRYLSRELGLTEQDIPKVECTKFEEWKKKISPNSATLVFSAYFLNNPSSTYGHSFIRLNKTDHSAATERAQLLDYGINYAASATISNPFLYAVYGLAGFFHGDFTSIPFYYKVREYNDFESRDLWEYDLNLTQEEVDALVEHFWELGSTYFDYFYLTENCSFHMLTALEAAAPRLNLTSRLPFWIIPADTVRAVYAEPGFVRSIHFRPSVRSQFMARLAVLENDTEVNHMREIFESRKFTPAFEGMGIESKTRILDAAIDLIDYKYHRDIAERTPDVAEWKQRFLVRRSQLPVASELKLNIPEDDGPHLGHASGRIGFGGLVTQNGKTSVEGQIRFALHDLLDRPNGYPEGSEIDFFNIRTRYTSGDSELKLEDFRIAGVSAFVPWNQWERTTSWRAGLGVERIRKPRCDDCLAANAHLGGGFSTEIGQKNLVYGLAEGAAHSSSLFPGHKSSLSVGPVIGARIFWSNRLLSKVEAKRLLVLHSSQHEVQSAFFQTRFQLTKTFSVDLLQNWKPDEHETSISLFHYF